MTTLGCVYSKGQPAALVGHRFTVVCEKCHFSAQWTNKGETILFFVTGRWLLWGLVLYINYFDVVLHFPWECSPPEASLFVVWFYLRDELVVKLVGASIEQGSSTPLMEAAQEGHVDLVKFLLEQGTLHFVEIHSEQNPSRCFGTNNPKGNFTEMTFVFLSSIKVSTGV